LALRVLALIPARGGSSRLPRKNLALLDGKTLTRRALETAVAARCFARVALSTDDSEIAAEAEGLEIVVVRRPPHLATATASSYDVVMHALAELDPGGSRFDAIGLVQCTSPFTAPEDLAGAVALLQTSGADSVVTVARVDAALHPMKLKILEGDRLLPYIEDDRLAPSHELTPLWVRNGSMYLSHTRVLEGGDLIAGDVRGYVMPGERSYDIDTPDDLAFAEFLLAREADGAARPRRPRISLGD
jgi:CMP-N-acetylneuraminic acid synthetase